MREFTPSELSFLNEKFGSSELYSIESGEVYYPAGDKLYPVEDGFEVLWASDNPSGEWQRFHFDDLPSAVEKMLSLDDFA